MENNKPKNRIRSIMLKSLIVTLSVLIILGIIAYIFGADNRGKMPNINIAEYYNFSGSILSTDEIYKGIILVSEEIKDHEGKSSIYALTLKNNKLISKVELNTSIDLSDIKNYNIDVYDYEGDEIKDFTYINQKTDNGYEYKLYSIDKEGKITCDEDFLIVLNDDRASVKIDKTENGYEIRDLVFYYDGYSVPAKVGKYKLEEKVKDSLEKISKDSKIAIKEKYNAIPRKYEILTIYPERLINTNTYLKESSKNECIEVDLEGDGLKEYIASFVINNERNVVLFDNSENQISILLTGDDNKSIGNNIEIADVDNDGIMEMIVVLEGEIEVHKYNNGFYY